HNPTGHLYAIGIPVHGNEKFAVLVRFHPDYSQYSIIKKFQGVTVGPLVAHSKENKVYLFLPNTSDKQQTLFEVNLDSNQVTSVARYDSFIFAAAHFIQ